MAFHGAGTVLRKSIIPERMATDQLLVPTEAAFEAVVGILKSF